ncbi:hypothetical protein, partial [Xenorhabdus bovienii]|uniref:hypothetical protein n=1 Tax=Xenorhabdus bovienii TaxID=40576 RepID=UPI00237C5D8D
MDSGRFLIEHFRNTRDPIPVEIQVHRVFSGIQVVYRFHAARLQTRSRFLRACPLCQPRHNRIL